MNFIRKLIASIASGIVTGFAVSGAGYTPDDVDWWIFVVVMSVLIVGIILPSRYPGINK